MQPCLHLSSIISPIKWYNGLKCPVSKRKHVMNYSPLVLDHFENPRYAGSFSSSEKGVYTGISGSPSEGVYQFQLKIDDNSDLITDMRFKVHGCGSAIAVGSYVCQSLINHTIDDASKLSSTDLVASLALAPLKINCAILAVTALSRALMAYRTKT